MSTSKRFTNEAGAPVADNTNMYSTADSLPERVRSRSVALLNRHLAAAIDLHAQLKQAHWNVRGPAFIAIHELLEKVIDVLEDYMDKIAERVGALGSTAERTVQTAAQRSFLEPYRLGVADPAAQIEAVTQALANFGESMRTAIDESESFEDIGTSDMFTEVSRGIDYQLWLVESHRPLQHHNAASRFGRDGRIRIMAGASAAHPN